MCTVYILYEGLKSARLGQDAYQITGQPMEWHYSKRPALRGEDRVLGDSVCTVQCRYEYSHKIPFYLHK